MSRLTQGASVSRRTAVALMGFAGAGALASCAGVRPISQAALAPPSPPSTPTAAPASHSDPPPAPAPPPAFAPDYSIPPIQDGLVPVITRVPTKQPVVFLTLDDGITKNPQAVALLRQYGYPVTMFLAKNLVQENPAYFRDLMREGDFVENHTVTHDVTMWSKPYAYQLAEIQGMQDYAHATFGRRPTLFRPPGGAYSATMRKACADAGIRAIIDWEAKSDSGQMGYQYGNALRPGDIVLMHFRPEFAADFAAFRAAQLAAGLTVANLERFIGAE
ncbi:MAG TPA: polysaccharide deacetylase family protein [Sinomonas sp.]|nr:polysaccharide deacetylase family protein [Sinomonas sp.]